MYFSTSTYFKLKTSKQMKNSTCKPTDYSRLIALILLILCIALSINAQKSLPSIVEWESQLRRNPNVTAVQISTERGTPSAIYLSSAPSKSVTTGETNTIMEDLLSLRKGTDALQFKKSAQYHDNIQVDRYQQYFKGIKVEHGEYLALSKQAQLQVLKGEFYALPSDENITPSIPMPEALDELLYFINAEEYAWEHILHLKEQYQGQTEILLALDDYFEEYYPYGELVFVDDFNTPSLDLKLAWKFDIYTAIPLGRANYYIDAHTGDILLRDAIMKHGSGDTRYSGTRNFGSEIGSTGSFELLNTAKGGGIETRDMQGAGGLPLSLPALYNASTPFEDNDGTWNSAEHTSTPFIDETQNDDIALDAHWGAEIVYDYWLNVHGRLSYDDENAAIISFVHYGQGYDNAFWNGSAMTYGDGSYQQGTNPNGNFAPLTSMDVCAHEVGHAICEHTSNLVYQRESGAMNEGFSDIWAACVENYVLTQIDNTWQEPECGEPTLANDYCGVHGNSGVLNKWFYLMTSGSGQALSPGAGSSPKPSNDDSVNDNGVSYSITGLGFNDAEQIAYLGETLLSPNSKFADAREATMMAAASLFGACSPQHNTTAACWDAVGVLGTTPNCTPRIEFTQNTSNIIVENSGEDGCTASKTIILNAIAVSVSGTATITATGTGANQAQEGEDFEVLTSSHNFSNNPNAEIEVEIYDDAGVEGDETFTVTISNGNFSDTHEITISDNDVAPAIGSGVIDILPQESFSTSTIPTGWTTQIIGEGGNLFAFNGSGLAADKAYITGTGDTPTYDQTANAHVILKSPLIDARGKNGIQVSYDFTAGGEADATDPSLLYDFGSFGYSENGVDFTYISNMVGTAGGNAISMGSPTFFLPNSLNNKQFYIAFRWFNDALVGSGHSLTIDNVVIKANVTPIETVQNAFDEAKVYPNHDAYFYSLTGGIMAGVKSNGGDFDCLDVKIKESGNGQVNFGGGMRTEKVFEITSANHTDTYDVTLYFSAAEMATWGVDKLNLDMIKVSNGSINTATPANTTVIPNTDLTAVELNTEGDLAYTATFSGFSTFALGQNLTALPVELTHLKAIPQTDYIDLKWTTATETNNRGFELQRKADFETDFAKIAWIGGAGNSLSSQAYGFEDRNVQLTTDYYYRLKQIDLDGQISYSYIVNAQLNKASNALIMVQPNPTRDYVYVISNEDDISEVQIMDLQGKVVKQITNKERINEISTTDLIPSTYIIQVVTNSGTFSQKLVKI